MYTCVAVKQVVEYYWQLHNALDDLGQADGDAGTALQFLGGHGGWTVPANVEIP